MGSPLARSTCPRAPSGDLTPHKDLPLSKASSLSGGRKHLTELRGYHRIDRVELVGGVDARIDLGGLNGAVAQPKRYLSDVVSGF